MPSRYALSQLVQKKLAEMDVTAEDVIRKALSIKAEGLQTTEGPFFPEGTIFISMYKDQVQSAKIKDGHIELNGKKFTSVSGAAAEITGRATTNGWSFWMVRFPGKNEVVPIASLRKDK